MLKAITKPKIKNVLPNEFVQSNKRPAKAGPKDMPKKVIKVYNPIPIPVLFAGKVIATELASNTWMLE